MKKSEAYRAAIAAVIENDHMTMADKVNVLRTLFYELYLAEVVES